MNLVALNLSEYFTISFIWFALAVKDIMRIGDSNSIGAEVVNAIFLLINCLIGTLFLYQFFKTLLGVI